MIQNTSILKVGGGLVAVGGTGVTGYIYREELLEFWNRNLQTYLVQASEVTTSSLSENYFCEFNNSVDKACNLSKLNFNQEKYVLPKEIFDTKELAPDTLLVNSFYKLTVNKYKIKDDFVNGTTEIEIKKTEKDSVKIAKFKIIASSEDQLNKSDKKWHGYKLLVKADKSVTSTATLGKCSIGIDTNKSDIACAIYEFNDVPSNKNKLNFSKIKKITDLNKIQSGRYYIIDFSEEATQTTKDKLNNLANIKKIVAKDSSTEKTSFSFVSKIISHIETQDTNYAKNEAIIFDDNLSIDKNHRTYIIAKTKANAGTTGFTTNTKNYKCTVDTNKHDKDCELIELKETEKTLLQLTEAETLTNPATLTGTAVKYFKIVANNELINAITNWDGTKEIKIMGSEDNSNTEYKKLEALFLVENGTVTKGKTNLSIINEVAVKPDSDLTGINTWNTYTCKVQDETNAKECEVYKFTTQPNIKNVSASISSAVTKVTAKTDWNNSNFYLINLKDSQKIDFSKLSQKNAAITVEVSGQNKVVATAKINFPLFNSNTTFDDSKLSSSLSLF